MEISEIFYLASQEFSPTQMFLIRIFVGIAGLIVIVLGTSTIRLRRVLMNHGLKVILRLFGKEEITGTRAVVIGGLQVLLGTLFSGVAVFGPMFVASAVGRPQNTSPPIAPVEQVKLTRLERLEPPAGSIPLLEREQENVLRSTTMGVASHQGLQFAEIAPDGGVLVGFRCSLDDETDDELHSIQAVYQVGDRYQMGDIFGDPGYNEIESIAPAGHVVSRVIANADLIVRGMKLEFLPFSGEGRLGGQQVQGDWLGSAGSVAAADKPPRPAVGIVGTAHHDSVNSLEILHYDASAVPLDECELELPIITSSEIRDVQLNPSAKRPTQAEVIELTLRDRREWASEGGLLVGVQLAFSNRYIGVINSIRPIFQTGTKYSMPKTARLHTKTLLARPGYAVGGVEMPHASALRLRFMRVAEDGRLDTSQQETSQIVGSASYFREGEQNVGWFSDGNPAVGIHYTEVSLGERITIEIPGVIVAIVAAHESGRQEVAHESGQ